MFDSYQKKQPFNKDKRQIQSKLDSYRKIIKTEQLQKIKRTNRFFNNMDKQNDNNTHQSFSQPVASNQILHSLILSQNILKLKQSIISLNDIQVQQIFQDKDLLEPIYQLLQRNISKVESILLVLKLVESCKTFLIFLTQKTGLMKKIIKEANNMKEYSKAQQIYLYTIWLFLNANIHSQNKKQVQKMLPNLMYLVQQTSINSQYWIKFVSFLSMYIDQTFQFGSLLLKKIFTKYNTIKSKKCLQKLQIYVTIQNIIVKQDQIQAWTFKNIVKIIVQSNQNLELNSKDYKHSNYLLSTLIQKLNNISKKQLKQQNIYIPQKQVNLLVSKLIEWLINQYPALFKYQLDEKFMYLLFLITKQGDFIILQEFYIKCQLVDLLVDTLQIGCQNQLIFLSLQILQILISKLIQHPVSVTFTFFSYLKSKNMVLALQNLNFYPNNYISNKSRELLQAFSLGNLIGRY